MNNLELTIDRYICKNYSDGTRRLKAKKEIKSVINDMFQELIGQGYEEDLVRKEFIRLYNEFKTPRKIEIKPVVYQIKPQQEEDLYLKDCVKNDCGYELVGNRLSRESFEFYCDMYEDYKEAMNNVNLHEYLIEPASGITENTIYLYFKHKDIEKKNNDIIYAVTEQAQTVEEFLEAKSHA